MFNILYCEKKFYEIFDLYREKRGQNIHWLIEYSYILIGQTDMEPSTLK